MRGLLRTTLALLIFVLLIGNVPSLDAADKPSSKQAAGNQKKYDGSWWLVAESEERSGFLEGAGDCLTWVAHSRQFSSTPNQLKDKITQYYKTHPADKALPVTDVWQKLASETPAKKPTEGGEVWKNPHWYLNGLWWRQGTDEQHLGFLEGYLWCMRERVNPPTETYSHAAAYYVEKINAYIPAHPKADDEAVAIILSRFRDKPAAKAKKPEAKQ